MALGDFSGQRLRGHRDGNGLSHAEVAEHLGCTEVEVSAWEAGELCPAPLTLQALAQLYACPADGFVRRRDDDTVDYLDAVVSHMPPLSDEDIQSVAAVWRRINQRRRGIVAAG